MARIDPAPRATLIDTNVLLDVLTDDPVWFAWSSNALTEALDAGVVVLSPVVYAELAGRFERIEDLEDAVPPPQFSREDPPWEAAFLAGRAHVAYRHRGGSRQRTLPDFLIGAHAAVRGYRLLTRDARRYRTAYPRLRVIAPD